MNGEQFIALMIDLEVGVDREPYHLLAMKENFETLANRKAGKYPKHLRPSGSSQSEEIRGDTFDSH